MSADDPVVPPMAAVAVAVVAPFAFRERHELSGVSGADWLVGSTLLALAVFGQVPGVFTVAGGVVVLVGIAVTTTGRAT
ncbi:hypothetical protein [Halobacterium noricense]|uniref:hypothetical protein n=1 Tax=Halobacterium noricense TaxID=223182 RepID=UPI0022B77545|nr:hypothetical protein [Halobacterium noricense]